MLRAGKNCWEELGAKPRSSGSAGNCSNHLTMAPQDDNACTGNWPRHAAITKAHTKLVGCTKEKVNFII